MLRVLLTERLWDELQTISTGVHLPMSVIARAGIRAAIHIALKNDPDEARILFMRSELETVRQDLEGRGATEADLTANLVAILETDEAD